MFLCFVKYETTHSFREASKSRFNEDINSQTVREVIKHSPGNVLQKYQRET